MNYKTFLMILGILVFILLLVIKLLKGKTKVFVKKTNWYTLASSLGFALLGLTGLAIKPPPSISPPTLYLLLQLAVFSLGALHVYLFYKINPWANRSNLKLEFLYTTFLALTGCLVFFTVFYLFEKPGPLLSKSYADNFCMMALFFPLPLVFLKMWDYWRAIPRQEITGWQLPIGSPLPSMLPGNSIHLTLLVTESFQSKEVIKLEALAPVERTLGEVFYYLLYRYNIEKKSLRKIEIAEENSKDRVYEWLFFKIGKQWWWTTKQYFRPDVPISKYGIQKGDSIIVGRVKKW